MDQAKDAIRRVIDERIAAIRARDAHSVVASLAEDVVAFELVPPLALRLGAARDEGGVAAWLAGFEEIAVEVHDLRIEADERVGFASALHHLTGTRVDGRAIGIWMRSTLCFRREAGQWKIAHAHTSVPFHPGPESKAAIDLQP